VILARDRITHPELARLADTIDQQGRAHLQRLQGWLASRGLAPTTLSRIPTAGTGPTSRGCPGYTEPGSTWPSSR
jgi:hypothetical protein